MITLIIISFLLSATLTWLLLSNKLGIKLLDQPNNRSLHSTPIPRSGGLAIAATLFVMFIINITALPEVVINIAIGALVIFSISVIDDIKHVPSILRLGFHLSGAGWLVYAGFGLDSVILPGGEEIILSKPVSWIITILLVTWMTNLYNFMDGMDGFAGGMTVIGFSVLAFVFLPNSLTMAMVSIIIVTATLGFLVFNFPPAKIFMGDSGSSLLGYLAASLMLTADKTDVMPIWLSVIVFSPFIIDATITLIARVSKKQKIWIAHKQHYYQRLVESGWSHRKTVLTEYCLMLICGIIAIAGTYAAAVGQFIIVGFFIILYIAIVFMTNMTLKSSTNKT